MATSYRNQRLNVTCDHCGRQESFGGSAPFGVPGYKHFWTLARQSGWLARKFQDAGWFNFCGQPCMEKHEVALAKQEEAV